MVNQNKIFSLKIKRKKRLSEWCRKDSKYWDRQAFANSVNLDHMPHSVASDQGLHCLPYIGIHTAILDTSTSYFTIVEDYFKF